MNSETKDAMLYGALGFALGFTVGATLMALVFIL
jgi:hypothetical protein